MMATEMVLVPLVRYEKMLAGEKSLDVEGDLKETHTNNEDSTVTLDNNNNNKERIEKEKKGQNNSAM